MTFSLFYSQTLPKIFPLTPREFKHYKAMSFEAVSLARNSSGNNINHNNQDYLEHHNLPLMELSTDKQTQNPATASFLSCESNLIERDSGKPLNCGNEINNISKHLWNNMPPTYENVMPGIYLARNFMGCREDELRMRNFKHIIIIDKHVQELFYPTKNIANAQKHEQRQHTQFPRNSLMKLTRIGLNDPIEDDDDDSLADEEEHNRDIVDKDLPSATSERGPLDFSKEFNVLNLNFGEHTYLTTVLPNCYKAVRFISKARQRQNNGDILVIDCNGSDQKCQTIVLAYLMYKQNLSFR